MSGNIGPIAFLQELLPAPLAAGEELPIEIKVAAVVAASFLLIGAILAAAPLMGGSVAIAGVVLLATSFIMLSVAAGVYIGFNTPPPQQQPPQQQ